MDNEKQKMETWSLQDDTHTDPQIHELTQQQEISKAQNQLGDSLASTVEQEQNEKVEYEQLGKMPWNRWYSHPFWGRDSGKGIADLIWLSIIGSPGSKNEIRKMPRGFKALVRVILFLIVVFILGLIKYLLGLIN